MIYSQWKAVETPLTRADEALMILVGFAKRDPDGVLSLTDKGCDWLRDWCRKEADA